MHKRERSTAPSTGAQPTSSTIDSRRPSASADKENAQRRAERDQQGWRDEQGAAKPAEEKKAAAAPSRAKLTEQWGEPPSQIRREGQWLQRGELLGEVRTLSCLRLDIGEVD